MLAALSLLLTLVPIAEPLRGGSPEYSSMPLIASNNSTFAVAWNGETPHVAVYDEHFNVVARVDGLGRDMAFVQDLAAAGRNYVLLYLTSNLLHKAVIAEDGRVIANDPVMPGWAGAIAARGSQILIMNEHGAGLLDDTPVIMADVDTYAADIAANRDSFFAVWPAADHLWGARLVPGSTRASAPVLIGPSDSIGYTGDRPSIASDGDGFVVAWTAGARVWAAQIDRNGMPSPERAVAIDATGVPSITWTGSTYRIVYPSNQSLVSIDFPSMNGIRVTAADRPNHPRIASSARASFVVRETFGSCYANHGIVVSRSGEANAVLVTTGTGAQGSPAAAADLVAFIEKGEDWRLRIAHSPFDGEVTTVRSSGDLVAPAIATAAGYVLVVWLERQPDCTLSLRTFSRVLAQRVAGTRPAIGWNGEEFVVVWQRAGAFAVLDGIRVAPDGTPIDTTPMQLTTPVAAPDSFTGVDAIAPSLYWNGTEWLLVWQYLQITQIPLHSDPPPISLVRTRRLSRDLQNLGSEQTIAENAWYPAMDGRTGVVAWIDPRGVVAGNTVVSNARVRTLTLACSDRECAVGADNQLLRLSRDGTSVLATQTFEDPIAALTSDGMSFLAITARDQRLYAIEIPPLGPRRRIAGHGVR